ncbi:MAG: bifunctional precorrin-2 dehydrogenase/sirohydrochlorin ferrochelatase [Oscillospiraceae bacterium]|nr:bifunctional precorrin-2 dehydrogenase/sirohydrochlorin ferrochelatase [Oscillospiraceae bacterium]
MAPQFPMYIDLEGNNCIIFGGGDKAAARASVLLKFGAKVTVISPTLCDKLIDMDRKGLIRHIPRRYYRGDCSSCYICIAATNDDAVNIAISDECKAKRIAVNVTKPSAFGTFVFPSVIVEKDITISVAGETNKKLVRLICESIAREMPRMMSNALKENLKVE